MQQLKTEFNHGNSRQKKARRTELFNKSAKLPCCPVGAPLPASVCWCWCCFRWSWSGQCSPRALQHLASPSRAVTSSLAALGGNAGGSTARQLQEALNSTALPLRDQWEALSGALKSAPGADLDALLTWAKGGVGGAKGPELPGEIKAKPGALILAHALHFRGLWDRGFEEDNQDLRRFLGTRYTKVSMIHRTGVYRHYEDMVNMVQVVELGLWGGKASLVLLLPFHVEPLTRLDRLLTPELLGAWLKQLANMSMAISLPKTMLSSALNLQKHLSALGLTDAWDEEKADFSGGRGQPAGNGNLHLGGVLHWASLELSPEGGGGGGGGGG
ncbi:hypothetical protein SKAU_G00366980 [Synaphobranchus kaupii]|uniref:Serpin domain-containing protein n=1 Tax=Synaphobranchus kaupii TaxID=118154 RepID=A0A9Q1EFA6_SYNKA|nr:hypothetical protein SKAU_G00366980 [Synaphobranchus kaupii]